MAFEDAVNGGSAHEFDDWLSSVTQADTERWLIIFKKASGKQTVTFDELLDVALCNGWIDVQTKSVDDKRYAIRFVRRKPGSNWSETNRKAVKRLIETGRMKPTGATLLPDDLD